MLHDMEALAARLKAARHLANPPRPPEPHLPTHAAAEWVAARGLRPGQHPAPPTRYLVPLVLAWCDARGWCHAFAPRTVGAGFKLLGFRERQRHGRLCYMVREVDADALWAEVQLHFPGLQRTPHHSRRRTPRTPEARNPPPFWPLPPRARPVVDGLGRIWPSAGCAARVVGCHQADIAHAIARRTLARGLAWRRARPEEVARVPPEARAGWLPPPL